MYLEDKEKKLISTEIENLEKKSSVELVAVITKYSSAYKKEALLVSLGFTSAISFIALFFKLDTMIFFQVQILVFTLFYSLLYKFNEITLFFLSKKYKKEKAAKKAKEEFINQGLYDTQTKQAIMFFVSIEEKYVEIMTDKKVKKKIENKYWQKIVDEFIKDVKNNQLAEGYLKAIKSSNKILIDKFPIQEDDLNELQNEVIEI